MLSIHRTPGQKIVIGENAAVTLVSILEHGVEVKVDAPQGFNIQDIRGNPSPDNFESYDSGETVLMACGETVTLAENANIKIKVNRIERWQVSFSFEAPREVKILREELL